MSPFLTSRGIWLLISGIVSLLAGAILSAPVILFLGQLQIALLGGAFLLLVPAAIALDRRLVTLEVIEEEEGGEGGARGLLPGEAHRRRVQVTNTSPATLYAMRARPFGAEALTLTETEEIRALPRRSRVEATFEVEGARCGRWVIQGFDVRVTDPLGLLETRDYLPCLQPLEFYPRVIKRAHRALRAGARTTRREGGRHHVNQVGMGTDIRELREHQPGDPLRHIAWKATVRRGKLISRNFEQEIAMSVYVLLDISSSMRGGQIPGQKLEHGVELVATLTQEILKARDTVGLITFDEKVYGHIMSSSAPAQASKILHHLAGLSAIVDGELTEFDDAEVEALVVDYLLVQERLDFRKGEDADPTTGINGKLLQRWLASVLPAQEERLDSPTLTEGRVGRQTTRARRFAQLRGLEIPYRVEARLGMKERGLHAAIDEMMTRTRGRHTVLIISDLCGIMNLDALTRSLKLAKMKGHAVKVIVPFTPSFYADDALTDQRARVLREVFSSAEREERMAAIGHLRAAGVEVSFTRP